MSSSGTRPKLAIAIGLALVIAVVVWWLRSRTPPAADQPAVVPAAATEATTAARLGQAPRRAPDEPEIQDRRPITVQPAVSGHDPDAARGLFTGRVLDWGTGRGVEGAEIVFSAGEEAVTVDSTTDGVFRFAPPALGRYKLAVASADGYLPFAPAWDQSRIELVARAKIRVEGIVIYLSPAITYAGRVLDPDGKPVAGAKVKLRSPASDEHTLLPIPDRFISGADGGFSFQAPDFAVLEAEHPCCASGRAILDGAAQLSHRLELRLGDNSPAADRTEAPPPSGQASLRGRVQASGAAVPAFSIAVTRTKGLRTRAITSASFFDGEGRFEIADLPAGAYQVQVVAHGYAPSEPLHALASQDPRELLVSLSKGGTLRGTVVDAERGTALELAKVTLEGRLGRGAGAVTLASSAITDAKGWFELAGLPNGRVSVVVAAHNHHRRIVGGLTVAQGTELEPIRIELTPVAAGEKPHLELAGIGAALGAHEDGLRILQVLDGGGAAAAGLAEDDVLIAVNGKWVLEMGFDKTIQEIRGVVGSLVTLSVRKRGAEPEELSEILVTRRKITH